MAAAKSKIMKIMFLISKNMFYLLIITSHKKTYFICGKIIFLSYVFFL